MLIMPLFLVFLFSFFIFYSSHKVKESCEGVNSMNCLICDEEKNRILVNGNYCECAPG